MYGPILKPTEIVYVPLSWQFPVLTLYDIFLSLIVCNFYLSPPVYPICLSVLTFFLLRLIPDMNIRDPSLLRRCLRLILFKIMFHGVWLKYRMHCDACNTHSISCFFKRNWYPLGSCLLSSYCSGISLIYFSLKIPWLSSFFEPLVFASLNKNSVWVSESSWWTRLVNHRLSQALGPLQNQYGCLSISSE